jgi:glycosyltransferase involved in cell wall biosynthesis
MRFALLSHVLPPSPSGQAVMLYRILSHIDPKKFYLISSATEQELNQNKNQHLLLQAPSFSLPQEPLLKGPSRFGLGSLRNILNTLIRIIVRTGNILKIVRREPANAIIACSGDLADIPAAFLASRMAHIQFFAYIFDDYVFQWTGYYRLFAKLVAPFIFKHSAGIIGPNEFICEEYRQRFGVSPTLVRNPCDQNELEKEPNPQWPSESGKIKIIYTGAVYHANYDCFRNLICVLGILKKHPLELHIYTAQTREQLETQGIQSKQVFIHSHVPFSDILEQQRKADILFLPLAFKSPIPEVIRTSAPGKMGEYLASGRPVLAHVPTDSFVAYYFKKHRCGLIADQNDSHRLAAEIEKLITNPEIRREMIQSAQRQVRLDYSPELARCRLIALLQKNLSATTAP